jgi:hypothetical protein
MQFFSFPVTSTLFGQIKYEKGKNKVLLREMGLVLLKHTSGNQQKPTAAMELLREEQRLAEVLALEVNKSLSCLTIWLNMSTQRVGQDSFGSCTATYKVYVLE